MGSTGMQRLKEKHANKRANVVKLSKELLDTIEKDAILPENGKKRAKNNDNNIKLTPEKAHITNMPNLDGLSDKEIQHFLKIWAKLEELYEDDASRFYLSAVNLAKIYALGERLSEEIEKDGGIVLQNEKGSLYAHPAFRLLQTNQSQILSHLKAMGMYSVSQKQNAQDKEEPVVSEFAQFH